jgi:hypothetical protein
MLVHQCCFLLYLSLSSRYYSYRPSVKYDRIDSTRASSSLCLGKSTLRLVDLMVLVASFARVPFTLMVVPVAGFTLSVPVTI